MNGRGQVIFYGFMLGLVILLLGLALAAPVKESVDTARTNMDCDNSSISTFYKAGCIATDTTTFYFVGALIMIGGLVIGARIYI